MQNKQTVKFVHNKKRNTAFLFESLARSLAKARLNKDPSADKIVEILKEFFSPGTELAKELKLYNLLESKCESRKQATRILQETVSVHSRLSAKKIFDEQTSLLKKAEEIKEFDAVFVPNYRSLATIYQIFHKQGNIKDRLILEDVVVSRMCKESDDTVQPVDSLTVKIATKKFNEAYKDDLLKEQKELLEKWVLSITPESKMSLKVYLNEEIGRLKNGCKAFLESDEDVKKDIDLTEKTKQVQTFLEGLNRKNIDSQDVLRILKIQQLVEEK